MLIIAAGCKEAEPRPGTQTPPSQPQSQLPEIAPTKKINKRQKTSSAPATHFQDTSDTSGATDSIREGQETRNWENRLIHARFRRIKPVSSRSQSLRLIFANGDSAIFKPLLKGDSSGRLEVAFYRLASILGIRGVPVSVMRPVYPDRFERMLQAQGEETLRQFTETVAKDDKGRVWGAMIQWFENLKPIGAEDHKGRLDVQQLFSDESYRPLWKNLSNIIMLDFLTGNWDRFSGGNLFRFQNSDELALIDHNEAFYRLNRRQREMLTKSLNAVPCLSEQLVEKIRGLNEKKIISAIETTNWQGELLRPGEIRNIFMRKDILLAFIDDRITAAEGSNTWKCQ